MLENSVKYAKSQFLTVSLLLMLGAGAAFGQTTAFTYQCRLTDGGAPANGNYDLQFALWDSLSGGTQIGSTQTVSGVSVNNGIFTVTLDFGANALPGASRFLEISARVSGAVSFTLLSPRQQITSTPYAVRSLGSTAADGLSSACVGCVQDTNINSVAGSKVNGTIPVASVPAGSGNYIQNTSSPQASSNFNISGNGTADGTLSGNIVNASTQYNIAGNRILSADLTNTFAGRSAGANNAGSGNSFFGGSAGNANTAGFNNSFFGYSAGRTNTSSEDNTFFGFRAGENTTVNDNSFFGSFAGQSNTMGTTNTFIGFNAGSTNTTGSLNTLIGSRANVGSANLNNATAIGVDARVDTSNSLVLGNGVNVGIGTTSPQEKLHISAPDQLGLRVEGPRSGVGAGAVLATTGSGGVGWEILATGLGAAQGVDKLNIRNLATSSDNLTITPAGNVGIGVTDPAAKLEVIGDATVSGNLFVGTLISGGNPLCINSGHMANCASSLRYKKDLLPFAGGLKILNRLRPITFTWKDRPERDLGLGAEDVAAVEPLLTFRNSKGEIEGVKYDKLTVVLINSIKEQQAQIQQEQAQIKHQRQQLESLQRQNKEVKARNTATRNQNAALQARLDRLERAVIALQRRQR
jgi:hypothetical protein